MRFYFFLLISLLLFTIDKYEIEEEVCCLNSSMRTRIMNNFSSTNKKKHINNSVQPKPISYPYLVGRQPRSQPDLVRADRLRTKTKT